MRISQKNVDSGRTEDHQQPSTQRTQEFNCLDFSFPKSSRILKRKHFKEIATARNRYFGKTLVIDYRSSHEVKLGITVVRQFGDAVERNLFKRRVREAFRIHRFQFEPYEMIVMPKKGIASYSLEMITKDLLEWNHVAQLRAAKSC